jgi:type I restriction enzyme S subunit
MSAGQDAVSGCLTLLSYARKLVTAICIRDEQQKIVRKIETALSWIDRLATEARSAHKLVYHLDQAILSKAFQGELVPQDPSDEPANAPLQRIRAERANASE